MYSYAGFDSVGDVAEFEIPEGKTLAGQRYRLRHNSTCIFNKGPEYIPGTKDGTVDSYSEYM